MNIVLSSIAVHKCPDISDVDVSVKSTTMYFACWICICAMLFVLPSAIKCNIMPTCIFSLMLYEIWTHAQLALHLV